jgi:cobalt-zinc-cadmium efflux system outer membrane protein
MRIVVLCATLAALVAPSSADAQSLPLTELDALARLSPESPRVRAVRADIEVARADVVAAQRWPNPLITFDRESVAGVTENMTMITQPLPVTGRRGFEVQAASALADASKNRSDDAVRRARADLRLAFAQLVAAQRREQELTVARNRLRELADVLAKREAAGDAAGYDRLRAEREVLDLDADRATAATARAAAQAAIVGFFADAIEPSRVVAVDRTTPSSEVPSTVALIQRVESLRGDLLALHNEVDAAHLSMRAANRRRVPEPQIVAGTKTSTAGGGDIGGVVTLQAVVPIFDHGRPERALALARASQAEARADAFRAALRTQIAAWRAAVLERRETAGRYRAAAVESADQIERIAQVSYDAGERGILELLDAYRTGSSARIRQVTLDLSTREAEIELEFVSGWEIP